MRQPHVDDYVRLTQDIPELALSKGEIGVVRSTWFELLIRSATCERRCTSTCRPLALTGVGRFAVAIRA